MYVPVQVNLGKVPKVGNGLHHIGKRKVYIFGGMKHRENGPAEIGRDGYEAWYTKGVKHRIGGPAVTYANGTKEWWEEGKLIRRESVNAKPRVKRKR